jgi:hypothetical protein
VGQVVELEPHGVAEVLLERHAPDLLRHVRLPRVSAGFSPMRSLYHCSVHLY